MSDRRGPDARKRWLIEWIRQPSAWVSIIAAAISISTFYLVYAKPGDVRIIMPDRVGVSLLDGDVLLLLPVTFTNTGAPRTVNHVTHVSVTMRDIDPSPRADQLVDLQWDAEWKFIGKLQYLQNYPAQKENASRWGSRDDALDYVARAFPFALSGGTSVTKLFDFVRVNGSFQESLRSFQLVVRAQTPTGAVSSRTAQYFCSQGALEEKYRYCVQRFQ